MKRFLMILSVLIVVLNLSSCQKEPFDIENRMTEIQNNLQPILETKNYNDYTWEYNYIDDDSQEYRAETKIKISENIAENRESYLYITFDVWELPSGKGQDSFSIDIVNFNYSENYNCSENDMYKTIDVDGFLDIVNSVSERELTKSEILEFFNNDKYNDEEMSKNYLAKKTRYLDFFCNYCLSYKYDVVSKCERFEFIGYCK